MRTRSVRLVAPLLLLLALPLAACGAADVTPAEPAGWCLRELENGDSVCYLGPHGLEACEADRARHAADLATACEPMGGDPGPADR